MLPEMSRSGWGFRRRGADCVLAEAGFVMAEDEAAGDGVGVAVVESAGFVVVVEACCCAEENVVAAGVDWLVVVVAEEAVGFVVVVVVAVCAGFVTTGGGSSAGGGIGCGRGRAAPERFAQRNIVRNSIVRRTARKRNPVRGIRKSNGDLAVLSFMGYAPGNVRMGFGSTKTAGRK